MENLIQTFRKIGNLSSEQEKSLLRAIQRIECAPKTLLQEEDRISNKIYFIEKGIARTFYYKNGKNVTYWIAMEKCFDHLHFNTAKERYDILLKQQPEILQRIPLGMIAS